MCVFGSVSSFFEESINPAPVFSSFHLVFFRGENGAVARGALRSLTIGVEAEEQNYNSRGKKTNRRWIEGQPLMFGLPLPAMIPSSNPAFIFLPSRFILANSALARSEENAVDC